MSTDLMEKSKSELILLLLQNGCDTPESVLAKFNKTELIDLLKKELGKPNLPPEVTPAKNNGSQPKVDISNLGLRTTENLERVREKVGETDLGKEIYTWKHKVVKKSIWQARLTLDEAKQLGKQPWDDWKPETDKGTMYCKVDGRRFMVTKEIYEQLDK